MIAWYSRARSSLSRSINCCRVILTAPFPVVSGSATAAPFDLLVSAIFPSGNRVKCNPHHPRCKRGAGWLVPAVPRGDGWRGAAGKWLQFAVAVALAAQAGEL